MEAIQVWFRIDLFRYHIERIWQSSLICEICTPVWSSAVLATTCFLRQKPNRIIPLAFRLLKKISSVNNKRLWLLHFVNHYDIHKATQFLGNMKPKCNRHKSKVKHWLYKETTPRSHDFNITIITLSSTLWSVSDLHAQVDAFTCLAWRRLMFPITSVVPFSFFNETLKLKKLCCFRIIREYMFSLWKPQTLFQAFLQKPIQWFQDDEKFKNCSKNQTIAISYVPLYSLPTELQRAEWYLFGHHCEICHEEISICGNGQKDQKPLQEGSEANGWEGHCQTGDLQFDTCIFLIFYAD